MDNSLGNYCTLESGYAGNHSSVVRIFVYLPEHSPQGDRYKSGCDSNWPTVVEISFLKARGFTVVRRVCFNFYYGDQLTLDEFNKHLLGDLTNFNDVTVIMDMWRGFGSAQRVLIKDICSNVVRLQEYVAPSDRVIADANRYIKSYLGGGPYMAIMGRLEMSLLTTHKRVPVIPFCLQETLKQWEAFKEDVHLGKPFLSIDIGKYGTKKYRSNVEPSLSAEVIKFFVGVFGSSMTFEQWERRFVTVSHVKDAGYIGLATKDDSNQSQVHSLCGWWSISEARFSTFTRDSIPTRKNSV